MSEGHLPEYPEDEHDPRGDVPASPFPDQPLVLDERGTVRFMENRVIEKWREIAEQHGYDLNQMARDRAHGEFTDAECAQAMQLTGYSVSGWGDLSFVSYEDAGRNDAAAVEFLKDPVTKLGDTVRDP